MLTAGALALAVIAPAPDQAEHGTDAVSKPLQALPATPELADHPLGAEIQKRQLSESAPDIVRAPWNRIRELRFDAGLTALPVRDGLEARAAAAARASRALPRRAVAARPAVRVRAAAAPVSRRPAVARRAARPVERPAARTAARPVERPAARVAERPVARPQAARPVRNRVYVQQRRVTMSNRGVVRGSTRNTAVRRVAPAGGSRDMRAVIAYAKAQVGKRYVRGGEGTSGFDCSGLTKRAYAKAGLSLPHSSGAQARRARSVSRSQARPGDLVVGRGHVGIYMGDGMMIDAGNSRTGVVYRKVYRGLSVSRLN
ncbi:C40 family peptidase [Actinoplanes subglobosus]|uniref:C40 family peptidase n=1 Tax=Actinoplanes subglobosus TaxID=1547892 RepID=A0ABV8IV76_9ACTN